jgi:hypothetical protein
VELINLMLAMLAVFAVGAAIVFKYLEHKEKEKR